jgi:hypothetical protein
VWTATDRSGEGALPASLATVGLLREDHHHDATARGDRERDLRTERQRRGDPAGGLHLERTAHLMEALPLPPAWVRTVAALEEPWPSVMFGLAAIGGAGDGN